MHHSSDLKGALDPFDQLPAVGAGQAATAALGTTAKSLHILTGDPLKARVNAKRAERYEALTQARHWLGLDARRNHPDAEYAGDVYRTHDCLYVPLGDVVKAHYSAQYQCGIFSGLVTCGSVWACPVCTAKIQQRRRAELSTLIEKAWDSGFRPAMLTFTFPHSKFDALDFMQKAQAKAFQSFRNSRGYKQLIEASNYKGLVRSLELLHGVNGWHLHTHELWLICVDPANRSEFERIIRLEWLKACSRSGLFGPDGEAGKAYRDYADTARRCDPSRSSRARDRDQDLFSRHIDAKAKMDIRNFLDYGVHFAWDASNSDYLAKQDESRYWGVDREMAAATSKRSFDGSGKPKGVHPHEFLIRREKGDHSRFIEYVNGMKGRSQLYWTNGLKDWAGVEEKSDEEITQELQADAELFALVTLRQWKIIRKGRLRTALLEVIEQQDSELLLSFLRSLDAETETAVEPCVPHVEAEEILDDQPAPYVRDVPAHLTRNALTARRKGSVMVPCKYTQAPFWLELAQWKLVEDLGAYDALVAVYETALRTSGLHPDSDEYSALAASVLDDALACLSVCHQ